MNIAVLEMVDKLPAEKQLAIEDYIKYLFSKYAEGETESVADIRRKNMGWAKGKIWMADDFNDTPDDFKDYL